MSLVAISPSTEVLATRRLLYRRRKCNLLFCRIVCHLQHRVRIDRLPPRMSSISTKCVCQGRSWQLPLSFPLERYMNFFFLVMRLPPRSTLFPYTMHLPV